MCFALNAARPIAVLTTGANDCELVHGSEAQIEMYLAGVSVHRVEDITEALWGTKVSPSTISELNKKAYQHIEAWRNRQLYQRPYNDSRP